MHNLPPQCTEHIAAANQLVVDESVPTVKRIIALADGDLCDVRPDGKRVYYRAPDISSIEYVINRALGTPGARIVTAEKSSGNDVEDVLCDVVHELEHMPADADPLDPNGPFRAILSAVAKRRATYRLNKAALEQRVIEFLPTAIERLTELCAGVTVRREYNGKTRTYTLRPNRRAIEHISKRIQGTAIPIVESLNGAETKAPDPTREYSDEEIKNMTTPQLIALFKASETAASQEDSPIETEPEPPAFYTAACVQMATFLPDAITHMKTLAQGATTVIEADGGERSELVHQPDARANQFLIDLFIGAPKSRLTITDPKPIDLTANQDAITRYTDTIIRICTSNKSDTTTEEAIRSLLTELRDNL